MIKTVFAALAGTLIAATSPAVARVDAEPAAAPAPAPAKVAQAPKVTRYCINEAITGSRLPVKSCRTREEWLATGFDPLEK